MRRDEIRAGAGRSRAIRGLLNTLGAVALLALLVAPGVTAQQTGGDELTIPLGNSSLVTHPGTLRQVVIGDPEVADAVAIGANEVIVHGRGLGSTTVYLVDQTGGRRPITVRVTADAVGLQQQLRTLFPGEDLRVSAMGAMVILEGQASDPRVHEKTLALAASLGEDVQILDHISVPDPGQILLEVRFAEVSRNALEQLGVNIMRVDPLNVRGDDEGVIGTGRGAPPFTGGFLDGTGPEQTFSDAINFFLFHDASNVGVFIQALKENGLFRSLAEPNLLAMPAESASFLAGGEFPFPVVQGGANVGAVTIQFREFGIRLNFVPDITNSGAVRLSVAPEVSQLDFSNGLTLQGFTVPALLSRRAQTVIELEDGQTFAIAGLVDNSIVEQVSKVPLLGDIPILGALFRSKEMRQERSELLVLVTPRIVQPLDQAPALPTGEPETWDWDKSLRDPEDEGGDGGEAAGEVGGDPEGGGS